MIVTLPCLGGHFSLLSIIKGAAVCCKVMCIKDEDEKKTVSNGLEHSVVQGKAAVKEKKN